MAGFFDILRRLLGWPQSPFTPPPPTRRVQIRGRADSTSRLRGRDDSTQAISGRVDTLQDISGRSDNIIALGGRSDNVFFLRGSFTMAMHDPVECCRGEAVILYWTAVEEDADIEDWTMYFALRSSQGGTIILTRTVGSGITITGARTATITLTGGSGGHTDRAAGTYYYTVSRDDAGSETVLSEATFTIKAAKPGSLA